MYVYAGLIPLGVLVRNKDGYFADIWLTNFRIS